MSFCLFYLVNSYNIIIFATNQGGVNYDTGIQDKELQVLQR
jgi:hypothetical protein